VESTHGELPLEILLGSGRFDGRALLSNEGAAGPGVDAGELFDRWSYVSDAPISLEKLEEMVRRQLPESVYRCKGIIHVAETPDER
jgi:G3E family GTPase